MQMTAKVETVGKCRILRVGGRIDFESALDFEQRINSMMEEDADCFVVELSEVELLSSAGLRVLLSTAKRISQRQASLGLAAPSDVVRQVFEISHFNLLFKIFPSVAEALTALQGPNATIQTDEPAEEASLSETASLAEKTESSAPVAPVVRTPASPEIRGVESSRTPLPPSVPIMRSTQEPPATSPPRPPGVPEPSNGPGTLLAQPSPLPRATQIPTGSRTSEPPVAPPLVPRPEAKYPAQLEVRAEGTSYPCKDGDVIGTEGQLAKAYFRQISNLAPRHLLIGQLDGRWFVFTPKNVQHPFILDGVPLRTGERKFLQFVEHQAEFSGHVFGLRLVQEQPKEGLFSRIFGRKKQG
jgi:anti-anti-sigma factor